MLSLEPELDFKPVSVEISGAVISRHNTIQVKLTHTGYTGLAWRRVKTPAATQGRNLNRVRTKTEGRQAESGYEM